jgi:hypothetical protein
LKFGFYLIWDFDKIQLVISLYLSFFYFSLAFGWAFVFWAFLFFGILSLAFLIGLFKLDFFTIFELSIEFNLGFLCIWAFYYRLAFTIWAFKIVFLKLGFLSYMRFNLGFFCIWTFYCSLEF